MRAARAATDAGSPAVPPRASRIRRTAPAVCWWWAGRESNPHPERRDPGRMNRSATEHGTRTPGRGHRAACAGRGVTRSASSGDRGHCLRGSNSVPPPQPVLNSKVAAFDPRDGVFGLTGHRRGHRFAGISLGPAIYGEGLGQWSRSWFGRGVGVVVVSSSAPRRCSSHRMKVRLSPTSSATAPS